MEVLHHPPSPPPFTNPAHGRIRWVLSAISLVVKKSNLVFSYLCTGGAYYVTYSFRFISDKSWDGGEGRGSFI
jgi:hypothetical protein